MSKKKIAIISVAAVAAVALLALLTVYLVSVFSPSDSGGKESTGKPTISAGTVTASAGDTVKVPIEFTGNPGAMGFLFDISYDADSLEYITYEIKNNLKNNMKKTIFLLLALCASTVSMFGQGAKNIKINEVLTNNKANLQDEYGNRNAWVELANTAFSTYNVRGMYITTDRRVLDKNLTVAQRTSMMSCILNGDDRTSLSARDHIVFFLNGNHAQGSLHLDAKAVNGNPVWVALYDGNGIDLIDSVSVPALAADQSYARVKDGSDQWVVRNAETVTPGIENYIQVDETKMAKIKREDPYGIGITVLSMGIVFFCLALLYVFFRILGLFMAHKHAIKKAGKIQPIKAAVKTGEKIAETGHKTKIILKDGLQTGGIDKEIYIAVIAMALKQYEDNVHDIESNIITIKPHHTNWNIYPEETIIP